MKIFLFILLLFAALPFCGCASNSTLSNAELTYREGHYLQTGQNLDQATEGQSTSEHVLANLYSGSAWFLSGDYRSALNAFSRAETGMEGQDTAWNWGGDYLARTYDGIMTNTYQGLSFLALGELDNARIAFNRLEANHGKAAQRNQRAIDKRNEEIRTQKEENAQAAGYISQVTGNKQNSAKLQEYNALIDSFGAYADYENPAGRLVSGLYRLLYAEDRGDLEKAIFHFKKVYGMTSSPEIQRLLDIAEARADGHTEDGQPFTAADLNQFVFVIFENGMGQRLAERRIDLVIPYNHSILYAGIALPELHPQSGNCSPYLLLQDGTTPLGQTSFLCDMDRVVAAEFKKELPSIIAKAITSAVIKVIVQAAAIEAAKQSSGNDLAGVVGLIGTVTAAATTHADIRHWNFLPKEFQFCIVQRPASGQLTIVHPQNQQPPVTLSLPGNCPNILYIKAPMAWRPALISLIPGPAR